MDPIYINYNQEETGLRYKIVEFIQTLVVFAAIGTAIYLFIAQPHKVSGSSMFPTLKTGDYIITNKIGYRLEQPKKGEIIVFKNPREESQDFIKRIIGVPGDRVKIEGGHFFVNDQQLSESSYLESSVYTSSGAFLREGEEITVSPNHYFVAGDNRLASSDSREWGFVTREEIIGKAFFRYWPLSAVGIINSASY
ncbi:signal peptidase I [Candidatus Daviesbacteria bacterium]|nr:signal peptidase I [Candidatus Daviesbacteria bacterium]